MNNRKKKVIAIDPTGGKTEYPSVADAAKAFGVKDEHIRRVLRGERKTCCGKEWEFVR